jgi:TolB protein
MRRFFPWLSATALMILVLLIIPNRQNNDLEDLPVDSPRMQGSSGTLAYIGSDGNIYITSPDQVETIAVTTDATAPPEGSGLSYPRVAWSPDGQLAYASVIRSGNNARSRLFIKQNRNADPKLVGVSDEHFVIYIHWSPQPCGEVADCSRLAYLIEEPDGIGLRLVEVDSVGTRNRLLGLGWPFYFSWSQDGSRMLWHIGGASRFNKDARLAKYFVAEDQVSEIDLPPGLFIAPSWSPSGEEWLAVTETNGEDALQRITRRANGWTTNTLIQARDKHIVFSWSPDGSRIAYSTLRQSGGFIFGPIHVYDMTNREEQQLTSSSFDISGFFWSPDGSRLAYLSRLPLQDEVWLQWRVVNLETGKDSGFAAFNPTYQMSYVISSFNQYAQSHRLWSPDGRYLVYADQNDARVERIWMVDTFTEGDADPIFVAEGTMAFWSWK